MSEYKYQSVDDYFIHSKPEHYEILTELRTIIREAIPEAEEVISYNMPAYKYKGILVYFAVFPRHIGFYPTPSGINAFKNKLAGYNFAKGSVQFPLNKKLPVNLIQDMCKFRLAEAIKK